MKVKLRDIEKNPFNTRQNYGEVTGLMKSIAKYGVLQSFPAREVDGKYQVAFGNRRLKAIQQSGIEEIDLDVKEINDEDMAKLALFENIHRKDLDPIELARAYNVGLKVSGKTHTEFAKEVGVSVKKVRDYLSILELPERILHNPGKYSRTELINLSRMKKYSEKIFFEMENLISERSLPIPMLKTMNLSISRIYSSPLPEEKNKNSV